MEKTVFQIADMDCPSEENLIRMKLSGFENISALDFDIPDRKLTVFHQENSAAILRKLDELKLNSKLLESESADIFEVPEEKSQRQLLITVLLINAVFFLVEMIAGLIGHSMGLVADSLDMLADALVYGMSLWVIGKAVSAKKSVATISGYFQVFLAVLGFVEVLRRFFGYEAFPDFSFMIGVSIFALIGNSICLYLLQKSKNDEAHMQASMIFTSNDVIINLGVIFAGLLVYITNSIYPDLIIGIMILGIVIRGSIRILKLGK